MGRPSNNEADSGGVRPVEMADELRDVPVSEIYYDPDFNVRESISLASVQSLAADIKAVGRLIQPIVIEPYGFEPGKSYRIVCGNRRFKAVELLRWEKVTCIITHGLSDHERWLLNVKENDKRKQLTIWEQARSLEKLYPGGIPAFKDVSEELGWSTTKVRIRFRLLGMPKEIQKAAHQKRLNIHEIRILQEIPDPDVQLRRFKQVLAEKRKKGRSTVLQKNYRPNKKKSSKEVSKILNLLLDAGIVGLPAKLAAWTQGWVDDSEIVQLIRDDGVHLRSLAKKVEELSAEIEKLRVLIDRGTDD